MNRSTVNPYPSDADTVEIIQVPEFPPLSVYQHNGGQKYAFDLRQGIADLSVPSGTELAIDHQTRIIVSAMLRGHHKPTIPACLLIGRYLHEPDHPVLVVDLSTQTVYVRDESPEFTWSFDQFAALTDYDLKTMFSSQRGRFIKHNKEHA